ncbi:MAG: serine/threonine protein phosphatase [Desulfarculus sp.]|nr:serine/threonine protein phosphatase [Desulfarculus sp.]
MDKAQEILAVGDLHGRHDRLRKLLTQVLPAQPAGTSLVFLGDYIDRGPDSQATVEALLDLKTSHPQTVLLMGNHERMLLDALEGRQLALFLANGGMETLASYGLTPETMGSLPAVHLDFLRGLPLWHETSEYIFVHAGLRPGVPLASQEERDLLWIRDEFIYSSWDFGKTVVFGHTPFAQPLQKPRLIGIDTGAGFGLGLTCVKLPERTFITVG